ncbi:MAG: prepilin-type N-terminal cleavage/methylation domain-containing protein, partial [Planctomycetota bacterium]|nr:prepilin-type N-terminal cleavage/methylation domain-containing protein [Planctomycetota bacterium]
MRRREGFTLIEILVVVSLLGVLMGLTVGLIARSGGGNLLLQSSNKVASLLSMARNASVGSEAFVSLIPGEHGTTARAYRHRQVFHWPCEDFVRASEIEILKKQGGVVIATGGLPSREGYHAQFSVGGKITLGTPPWLQMRDGVSIECLINPDLGAQMGRMVLFRKGRTYVVRLVRSGVDAYDVEAEIRVQEDDRAKSRNVTVRTGFRAGA